jgi:hypothetical protein
MEEEGQAITQLRGLSTHPTNSIYFELHWVKRDGLN